MPAGQIEVHFQHYRYEISSENLTRYGSPYYTPPAASAAIWRDVNTYATLLLTAREALAESHVICGNEAFPESALADPLADIRIWNEWESGSRIFPYPGKFSRLGLTRQEQKIAAPTSVGVFGEIATGIFSQGIIAPQVLVRAIRHWPDFIFHTGGDLYAFVESKAFTNASLSNRLASRIPEAAAKEVIFNAIRQLNADPHLDVWGVFTGVVSVDPDLVITVTALQIAPAGNVRSAYPRDALPPAVVSGLASRAIAQAATGFGAEELDLLCGHHKEVTKASAAKKKDLAQEFLGVAEREIEGLLAESATKQAVQASLSQIHEELKVLISKLRLPAREGDKFFSVKQSSSVGVLRKIRAYADQSLFMADMDSRTEALIRQQWTPDLKASLRPFSVVNGVEVWRCGGSFFAIGPLSLEGVVINTGV